MSPSVSVRLLLTQSDERLVEYARAGHERAFEALVRRYRRQLHGYCRRLLLSDERAEDALQQALLQAWVALRDGTEVRDVRPWLYRIVHNAAVNALRVSGYDYCKLSESLSGAGAPQEDLDRRIAVREALAGLAALPQMQREALLRTAVEGRSHQQAASDLGLSEPALRGLVYRARAAMRATAGALLPPPAVSWALEAGTRGSPALERVAGLSAGGGSAGLAGLLVKGGAVAVTAGALAGGLVSTHPRSGHARVARAGARVSVRAAAPATTPDQGASVQPAAFARPSGHDATGGGRLPAGGRMRRPFAPIPILIGERHSHGDRSGLAGTQSGDSGRSTSRDGHGESSGVSGPGPGEGEQKGSGGTILDGGSTSSGKDGSGGSLSAQPSGGGESISSGDGGSGSTKDGSGDSQLSESTSGSGSSTSTSDSKDGAGITEPSKSG